MALKVGQYISDGEQDWLICAITVYKDKNYIYVVDDKTDDVCFYEFQVEGDVYTFEEVVSDHLISDLILHFAKQEMNKIKN